MNDDDIDATYRPMLTRVAARREEMERMLDKVALSEYRLPRTVMEDMLAEYSRKRAAEMRVRAATVWTTENHRPECRSWLPTEPPCTCMPTLAPPVLIIIAPTYQEGRYHLTHTLGLSGTAHRIIWHRDSLEYLRGLRWPLRDGYRLEIIGYPDDILQGTYIRTALREMGVPPEEIYEQDTLVPDLVPDVEFTLP